MDESLCFDDFVGSDAYDHPTYPLFDDEESASLFRAFTDEACGGLGAESGLSSASDNQSTTFTCLVGQTSEATSDSSLSPLHTHSLASSASGRVTKPVSANNTTGARNLSPPTPPTPVIPTPSGAPSHSPVPGIVSIPPSTLSVNFAEAPIAFANTAPGPSQTPCPPGPAYASEYPSGRTMQGPTHPPSGAAQAPALQPFCAGAMPGPFYPYNFVPTAPVAGPYPTQPWPAPMNQGNTTAAPSSVHYSMEMPPPPAPASAMSSPVSAPSKKRTWEFANPVTPTEFVANPDNHGRFQYVNGQRIYLNGPKAKKLCKGGKQGN